MNTFFLIAVVFATVHGSDQLGSGVCTAGTCRAGASTAGSSMLQVRVVLPQKLQPPTPPLNGCEGCFSAWDADRVHETCHGVGGAHASLLETEPSLPSRPHWSVRRFPVGDSANLLYEGSADIVTEVPNAAIYAVFFFHGARRDAITYFCSIKRIMEEQGVYDAKKALMISPKFAYADDLEHAGETNNNTDLWWNGSKPWGDYRLGAHSDVRSAGQYSSFGVVDSLILWLEDKTKFPMLKEILLMGHSAGAQTVQRYALTTHLEEPRPSGMTIRYAVANPSTYAYLDENRWSYDCNETACSEPVYMEYTRDTGRAGWKADRRRRRALKPPGGSNSERARSRRRSLGFEGVGSAEGKDFVCRSTASSESAHYWGYGLVDSIRTDRVPYVASIDVAQAKAWYKARDVVYFVGEEDTCTDDLLKFCDPSCWARNVSNPTYNQTCGRTMMDMTCNAMLQGPNRRERGKLYMQHLKSYYGQTVHQLKVIDFVGHQGDAMFLSPSALDVLFPKQADVHDSSKCTELEEMQDFYGVSSYTPKKDASCCGIPTSFCAENYVKVTLGPCAKAPMLEEYGSRRRGSTDWGSRRRSSFYSCMPPKPNAPGKPASLPLPATPATAAIPAIPGYQPYQPYQPFVWKPYQPYMGSTAPSVYPPRRRRWSHSVPRRRFFR